MDSSDDDYDEKVLGRRRLATNRRGRDYSDSDAEYQDLHQDLSDKGNLGDEDSSEHGGDAGNRGDHNRDPSADILLGEEETTDGARQKENDAPREAEDPPGELDSFSGNPFAGLKSALPKNPPAGAFGGGGGGGVGGDFSALRKSALNAVDNLNISDMVGSPELRRGMRSVPFPPPAIDGAYNGVDFGRDRDFGRDADRNNAGGVSFQPMLETPNNRAGPGLGPGFGGGGDGLGPPPGGPDHSRIFAPSPAEGGRTAPWWNRPGPWNNGGLADGGPFGGGRGGLAGDGGGRGMTITVDRTRGGAGGGDSTAGPSTITMSRALEGADGGDVPISFTRMRTAVPGTPVEEGHGGFDDNISTLTGPPQPNPTGAGVTAEAPAEAPAQAEADVTSQASNNPDDNETAASTETQELLADLIIASQDEDMQYLADYILYNGSIVSGLRRNSIILEKKVTLAEIFTRPLQDFMDILAKGIKLNPMNADGHPIIGKQRGRNFQAGILGLAALGLGGGFYEFHGASTELNGDAVRKIVQGNIAALLAALEGAEAIIAGSSFDSLDEFRVAAEAKTFRLKNSIDYMKRCAKNIFGDGGPGELATSECLHESQLEILIEIGFCKR